MSEEKQAGGQILAVARKEKNFSLKIGDEWYSGWNDKFKENKDINKGDKVEISYIENESGGRTYKNIVEGKLKITKGELKAPALTENNYAKREEEKREDILRSVSLKAGVETACKSVALKTWDESEGEKENLKERIIYFADEFYKWLKDGK